MIEFGSDFHYIAPGGSTDKSLRSFYPSANYYADGRQALIDLYRTQGWERLWIPDYFCYDVVESLKQAGLDLRFYADYPESHDDIETLEALKRKRLFLPRDAVLRVNYFGMRSYRGKDSLPIAVIEDHTHDLIGAWAYNSTADWCIASLRKTLPIPEGGIMWSPRGLLLPEPPCSLPENETIAKCRWEAMELKARYLAEEDVDKSSFRAGLVDTEAFFDRASVCALDHRSTDFLNNFNIQDWYSRKRENWCVLRSIRKDGVRVLEPECIGCYPFSLILVFDSFDKRDRVRRELIDHKIFPAVLWITPPTPHADIYDFSRSMLSIHCDARYSNADVLEMKSIIESIL